MTRVLFMAVSLVAHGAIAYVVVSRPVMTEPRRTEQKLAFIDVPPPPLPIEQVLEAAAVPKAPAPKRKQPTVPSAPLDPPAAPEQSAMPPVLGISFASTVSTGAGPSLAVGSARDGQRAKLAPPQAPVGAGDGVNVVRPARTEVIEPTYPAELRAQGIEADVTVRVKVGADGSVLDASVVKAAPDPAFNVAALATAKRERFTPGTRDGVPVPFVITFTYRFRIET